MGRINIPQVIEQYWPDWKNPVLTEDRGEVLLFTAHREDLAGKAEAAIQAVLIPGAAHLAEPEEGWLRITRDYAADIARQHSLRGYDNIEFVEDYRPLRCRGREQYLVLKRTVPARSLTRLLEVRFPRREELLRMANDLTAALAVCHRERICHGAVRPDSVSVTRDGKYQLGNFGLSRCLGRQNGTVRGSGAAAAGEAAERTDAAQLGWMLWRLACPRDTLPRKAEQALEVLRERIRKGDPQAPETRYLQLVVRLCSPVLRERFRDLTEAGQYIRSLMGGPPAALRERAAEPDKPEKPEKPEKPREEAKRPAEEDDGETAELAGFPLTPEAERPAEEDDGETVELAGFPLLPEADRTAPDESGDGAF